jgi:hypothetical protein
MRHDSRASVHLGRTLFGAAVLVSLVVLFAPAADVPSSPPGVEKIVHAAVFPTLAATGRWAGVRPAVLLPGLVAYAAGSEVVQGLSGIGRTASVLDWAADVVGVLAGLLLWAPFGRSDRP